MVALSLIINKDCLSKFAKIHMCVGRDAGGDKIYLNEKKKLSECSEYSRCCFFVAGVNEGPQGITQLPNPLTL